jgi:hypothetical protein
MTRLMFGGGLWPCRAGERPQGGQVFGPHLCDHHSVEMLTIANIQSCTVRNPSDQSGFLKALWLEQDSQHHALLPARS